MVPPDAWLGTASRVAAFLTGGRDDELQADVVGFVSQLLDKVAEP